MHPVCFEQFSQVTSFELGHINLNCVYNTITTTDICLQIYLYWSNVVIIHKYIYLLLYNIVCIFDNNNNNNNNNGPDEISARMLLLCDDSIVLPLKLIFQNILLTGIFPDLWKCANITPIRKKGDKQLKNIQAYIITIYLQQTI